MNKLSKITAICKQFANEFGETIEGQGYLTILKMLEMSGYAKPTTALEIHRKYLELLKKNGIREKYPNIKITVYTNEIKIESYTPVGHIECESAVDFFSKLENLLNEKGEEVRKKQEVQEDIDISK